MPLRRPRRHPKPYPLFDDDEQEDEERADSGPPDFVDSMYQRRAGDQVDGEFCPDWVIKVTGSSKAELLVLAKIAYWFAETKEGKLKVKEYWNGRWWLFKTYREIARDLRMLLTPDAVRGAVRSLEESGILISDYDSARSPPKLYRIDPNVVASLVTASDRDAAARETKRRLADDG